MAVQRALGGAVGWGAEEPVATLRSAPFRSERVNRLLLLVGTRRSSASGGQCVCFGYSRRGQCCTVWLGARAQPPAAILPVLGKLRKLHPMSTALCLMRQEALRTPCRGGTERPRPVPGVGEGGGSLGESSGVVLRDGSSRGVVVWPFLIRGIKRETKTVSC